MPIFQSGGGQVGSSQITDGAIVNADVNSAAAIERTKLANPLLLKVRKSSNQSLGGLAVCTFDTEITDVDAAFASNTYTSPRAQTVKITFSGMFSDTDSSARWVGAEIRVNGSAIRQMYSPSTTDTAYTYGLLLSDVVTLAQGDTVDIRVAGYDSGHSCLGGATNTQLTIELI